jgi:hypothetical protein
MEETQAPQSAPQGGTPEPKKDYTKYIIIGVVVLAVLYGAQMFISPGRMVERHIERAIERETGADVDIDYDRGMMGRGETNVTFSGEDGETYEISAGEDVAIPDTWPRSVPIPGDAKVTYAGTMGMGMMGGGGTTLAFTTTQSVTDITEYYKRELVANGWTIAGTMATPDGSMVSATRGEGENVVVSVGASPDGTTVSMTVQANQ